MEAVRFRIVGIAGSLRKGSFNRGLIRAAAAEAPPDIDVVLLDLGLLPLYDQDLEDQGDPPAVLAFKTAIRLADALLISTPEYNHGMSGVLKNAIDWASRPRLSSVLHDKPVAVMGASPAPGAAARAVAQVREASVYTGACAMPQPELLVGQALDHFDDHGNVSDPNLRAEVRELVLALRDWSIRIAVREQAA